MSVPAVGPVASGSSGVSPTTYLSGAAGVGPTTGTAGAAGTAATGSAFGTVLGSIDSVQQLQSTADGLAVQAVTGKLDDVHDYAIAATEAKVALELTAAVRNKAVEAFTEIMRMQA